MTPAGVYRTAGPGPSLLHLAAGPRPQLLRARGDAQLRGQQNRLGARTPPGSTRQELCEIHKILQHFLTLSPLCLTNLFQFHIYCSFQFELETTFFSL